MIESIAYYSVKIFGGLIRLLPINVGLWIGRQLGRMAYYIDVKHKYLVYVNLKIAFANTKTPKEIKQIARQVFMNFGQNIIELLRLPLLSHEKYDEYIHMEGKDNIIESLKAKKGVILLAMHYGSWELGSLASAMMGHPYKVIVKSQKRFSRLDQLLNTYRECNGTVTLTRGIGTRDFVRSLHNNEIVAMVVDQGGKEGMLVPFFDRQASMSIGAIRIALKYDTPICFVAIQRQKGPYHRVYIHKALDIQKTGDMEEDIKVNLMKVTTIMEEYIRKKPSEYMWFYKIWKYSKDAMIAILDDGRTGHLRQSQTIAKLLKDNLAHKGMNPRTKILQVRYRNPILPLFISVVSLLARDFFVQGRVGFLRHFLTQDSFHELMSVKADFILSCGSRSAGINYLLSCDQQAKSVAILKPGILSLKYFDLIFLPYHDRERIRKKDAPVVFTKGAPNLIEHGYLEKNKESLLNRYSHLKSLKGYKLGLLLGGDTKEYKFDDKRIRMVVHQIAQVAEALNAEILVTTSRRTPANIDNLLMRELKKHPRCALLIIANRNNIPEAVGGILALSDIVVVSGDSISMISEAASSGKKTIVFAPKARLSSIKDLSKHAKFMDSLNEQGHILTSDFSRLQKAIFDVAKNKITLKPLDDRDIINEALKKII